ncbi:AAA family ATPase [Herbidospora cretacea]|uniref:AAA family ATPase n=1 Tax=Herbidospora cretacea TaxID=28444 RepID=UPI0004C47007|nr:DUF3696 domain-containing protein [Herbidospora cretacea]
MSLERMWVEGYRCFAERQVLELRPLTVVLGRNNSGKSALVRAPLVLSNGLIADVDSPLDLTRLGQDPPAFVDLVHQRFEHGAIRAGFEFQDDEGPIDLEVKIQNVDEWDTQVISEWRLRDGDAEFHAEWLALPGEDPTDLTYRLTGPAGVAADVRIWFVGLLPSIHDEILGKYNPRIRKNLPAFRHLSPFRHRLGRTGELPSRPPTQDPNGKNSAAILIYDHVRRGGRLVQKVNELAAAFLSDWEFGVESTYTGFGLVLRSLTSRGLSVPLADTGTGITQMLPIFIRRAIDELSPSPVTALEIVEEPELNLHPAAQAELAELYISAIRGGRHRFLIETHSETFLLRLRRRVAEGVLDPEHLALYFVESASTGAAARRITIDSLGNVDHWPDGIFAEDFEEVRAMAAAQLERQDDDAR